MSPADRTGSHLSDGRWLVRGIEGRVRYKSFSFCQCIMPTKLFVGSLPFATTDEELRDFFAQAGEVTSARVIMDKMTGRSRGFGFVEFTNDADAQSAIKQFDGSQMGGRTIVVNEAKPMEARAPRGNSGGYSAGNGSY